MEGGVGLVTKIGEKKIQRENNPLTSEEGSDFLACVQSIRAEGAEGAEGAELGCSWLRTRASVLEQKRQGQLLSS